MPKKKQNKRLPKRQAPSNNKSEGNEICPNCGGKNGNHQTVRVADMIEVDCWRGN